mmetsp:Transcript_31048/g.75720  ORF Transcript_31048/g.75720 Transcript_31048/m.75720 type:complete len:207 (-) Transcript_31048:1169-1789(-)
MREPARVSSPAQSSLEIPAYVLLSRSKGFVRIFTPLAISAFPALEVCAHSSTLISVTGAVIMPCPATSAVVELTIFSELAMASISETVTDFSSAFGTGWIGMCPIVRKSAAVSKSTTASTLKLPARITIRCCVIIILGSRVMIGILCSSPSSRSSGSSPTAVASSTNVSSSSSSSKRCNLIIVVPDSIKVNRIRSMEFRRYSGIIE